MSQLGAHDNAVMILPGNLKGLASSSDLARGYAEDRSAPPSRQTNEM